MRRENMDGITLFFTLVGVVTVSVLYTKFVLWLDRG